MSNTNVNLSSISNSIINMLEECKNDEIEIGHEKADSILCSVLQCLGEIEIVNKYNEIKKLYD